MRRGLLSPVVAIAVAGLLAVLPLLSLTFGPLLPGPVYTPGSLQLLAIVFVIVAVAVTYDVLFGYTGLLSFGHALYFAIGCYASVILANSSGFGLGIVLALVVTAICALAGNALALRLTGIGYTMTTLALAQLMYIGVQRGYLGSGGEFGVTFERDVLPSAFLGLANTRNVYWLALAVAVLVYGACHFIVRTQVGHVWQAIRENPTRATFLGYDVYWYRVASATFTSFLAGICGIVYAITMGGANPTIVSLVFSLSFILMVVLGGRGVLWGAVIGGVVYSFCNLRLPVIARSGGVSDLPEWLAGPLAEPTFVLGIVFVLTILLLPGGLASLITSRVRATAPTRTPAPPVAGIDTRPGLPVSAGKED
jgi:branched-chain amino acid transport system permease protein